MTPITTLTRFSIAIIVGTLASMAVTQAAEIAQAKTAWKVSAELEEACSCQAACPCWFKSLPTRMTCDGMQVVFISKGRYGKTSLDGLALGQFVQSPEHKTMFESFGNWNFDYVYIDDKANEEQRAALKDLATHFFPQGGKERKFRFVPISRKIEGEEHLTTIGEYGMCSGHLIGGGFKGAPKVVNPPLADPTHKQFLQGQTTKMIYKDAGQDWKYENSNYMFNQFKTDHKEYAKYEAEMARQMAKMKM